MGIKVADVMGTPMVAVSLGATPGRAASSARPWYGFAEDDPCPGE